MKGTNAAHQAPPKCHTFSAKGEKKRENMRKRESQKYDTALEAYGFR